MTDVQAPPVEQLTVTAILDDRARRSGDVTALWLDDVPYTFGDLDRRSRAAASALLSMGVRPGEAVALLLESCIELVDVWLGAAAIGVVSVPINIANRGDFLAHQLRDSRAVLVLADASTEAAVRDVAGELSELRMIVVVGKDDIDGDPDASWPAEAKPTWDGPACVLYTSGTTGPSKGVVVTQHYLVTAARIVADAYGLTAEDVTYGAVPLFHFSGMLGSVLAAVVAGSSAVVDRRFSVSGTWDRVRRYDATGIIAVASMILMLWNLPQTPDEPKLRFLAGAPIPAELHRRIEARYNCRIVTMYGMTEAFPLAVTGVDDEGVPGSAGALSPLFDVRIVDDSGTTVAPGEAGEIVCRPRAPHVMFEEYHRNPEATAAQWRDGWFHTGDFGRLDEHGNLFFVDRKKDAMRRRGENISSYEVEQAVLKHPAVADVAAHAVPSEFGEDDVKICVVLRESATPEELLRHCEERMPRFAVPRYIELVDDLPRNAVGRVLKYVLRERGVTAQTWDRERQQ